MPIELDAYLRAHGFAGHPFASTSAEREAERLPSYFVRTVCFDWLVGDPRRPESCILFAPQGYGKTSHRIEIARLVGSRRDAALVVVLNDMQPLQAAGPPSITSFIHEIRRRTLLALDQLLRHAPARAEALCATPGGFERLYALWDLFAPRCLHERAIRNADTVALFRRDYVEATRGPKEWLNELAEIAVACNYTSVYLLLDGFDELTELRDNAEAIFGLLRPLLDAPGVLDETRFAFKIFLPHSVEEQMRELRIGRLDRIPHRRLDWSNEDLGLILVRRMASFRQASPTSLRARTQLFQSLCDGFEHADLHLVTAAAGSPRELIKLAAAVIERHLYLANDPTKRISATAFADVLRSHTNLQPHLHTISQPVAHQKEIQSTNSNETESRRATQPAFAGPLTPHVLPLFIDDRGDVFLGEHRLNKAPPKLVRRCLIYLWQHRTRLVTYDEMQEALYADQLDSRETPRDSMNKLIRRLRELLEPGCPASRNYIDIQTGTGFVLRNWRDGASKYP